MSDRIAVMNRGRVEQVDEPEAVYERPATTFVAGFIGVSNLMPAVVEQRGGERTRVRLDAGVEIEAAGNGFVTGERCHAVVRPEKLEIGRREDSTKRRLAVGRGDGRVLRLSRHSDADRRPPRRRRADDRPRPERGRGRARPPAGRRRERAPQLGARAHPSRQGIGRSAEPRRRTEHGAEEDFDRAARRCSRRVGLAACGGDDTRRRRQRGGGRDRRGRPGRGRARRSRTGRATSTRARTARSPSSRRRPASRSTTSRTSTRNLQFFGKVQPLLDQGESGGRDIIVVTDWMAKQMYDLGYLQEIDPDDIPTVLGQPVAAVRSPRARTTPSTSSRSRGRAG